MQTIDLPDEFRSQALETIRVIDTGAEDSQRIFLAGITVETGEPSADVTPPVIIAGPSVSEIMETAAVITWSTDEAGSTVVEYGTTAEYGLSATEAEGTEHRVKLTELTAGTTYHFRVGTADASGNAVWSGDATFETEREISLLVQAIQGYRRVDSPLRTRVGRTLRFEVLAFSAPDSSDLRAVEDYTWELPEALGTSTRTGELELTTVAGVSETILFRVGAATAEFQVIITPHSIRTVEIEPAELVIEPGGRQTFRARALDQYGNSVLGKNFGWHVVGDIGTINNRTGTFVAGDAPGEGYVIAVVNTVLIFADVGATIQGTGKVVVRRSLPERFCLYQNAPNPFNPSTEIRFDLPAESRVRLAIFNLAGQEIERLIDGILPAGAHQVRWEAEGQPSGIYLYRLEAGEQQVKTRTMALVR